MRKLKVRWVGLKLSPPLLLKPSPLVDLDKEKDKRIGNKLRKYKVSSTRSHHQVYSMGYQENVQGTIERGTT
jgi:hypothetical protein